MASDPAGPGFAQVSVFSDWDGSVAETIDLSASDGVAGDLFGMRVAIGRISGSSEDGGVAYVSLRTWGVMAFGILRSRLSLFGWRRFHHYGNINHYAIGRSSDARIWYEHGL